MKLTSFASTSGGEEGERWFANFLFWRNSARWSGSEAVVKSLGGYLEAL